MDRARGAETEDRFDALAGGENVLGIAEPGTLRGRSGQAGFERAQKLAFVFWERGIRMIGVMLQAADDFGERVAIVFRSAKRIDDALET